MLKISKLRENLFRTGLVVVGFSAAVAMSVWAATTISTSLSTGGTLTVSDLSTLAGVNASGVVNASSTAHITGATTLGAGLTGTTLNMSGLSTLAGVNLSGVLNATSTAHVSGNTILNTLTASGLSTLAGVNASGVLNATSTAHVSGKTTLGGTLKIGASGSVITQVLFSGTCTVNPPALQALGGTAAGDSAIGDTGHASCTDATGVGTSDTVFISKAYPVGWINDVIITSASSTNTNTINFVFKNTSTTTAQNIGSVLIPWMSIQ